MFVYLFMYECIVLYTYFLLFLRCFKMTWWRWTKYHWKETTYIRCHRGHLEDQTINRRTLTLNATLFFYQLSLTSQDFGPPDYDGWRIRARKSIVVRDRQFMNMHFMRHLLDLRLLRSVTKVAHVWPGLDKMEQKDYQLTSKSRNVIAALQPARVMVERAWTPKR